MKVLGFVGSPRKKGNTDVMVDTFLDGAKSAEAEVKKYFLADLTINQCQGCFRLCMLTPGIQCKRFRDDMDTLMPEMAASDIMLFASPLYCSVYTAIMARFFERCLPFWEVEIVGELGSMDAFRFINLPLKGKKAVIGMVQDFKDSNTAKLALTAFEKNLCKTYMMELAGKIHVTDVRDVGDIRKKSAELEKIFALGKQLASGNL